MPGDHSIEIWEERFYRALKLEAESRFSEAVTELRALLDEIAELSLDGSRISRARLRLCLARVLGALREEGDHFREEALALCRQIVEKGEGEKELLAQAWFLMASLLDDLPERYEEAVEAYESGLSIDGDFIVAHNNLGAVLCELARYDEAEKHFFRALELRPEYTKAHQNLAKMYFRWMGEDRLRIGIDTLISTHGSNASQLIRRLMVALVDFARQDAYEDFYSRGHRLKNLFSILSTRTKRLKRKSNMGQLDEKSLASQMEGLVKSMQAATDELKEFLAILRPRQDDCQYLDVNDLLRKTALVFSGTGVELEVDLSEGLPPIAGEKEALAEALVNLSKNALDASPPHGRIRLSSSFSRERQEVVLGVEDSGTGVAEKDARVIFRPGVSSKSGGNGLGLAVVKRVLQDFGGRCTLERSDLGGALFQLHIPAVEGAGAVVARGLKGRFLQRETTTSLLAEELTQSED